MTATPHPRDVTRVLIRADASAAIGTGHLSRCLALAAALRDAGAAVIVACADATPTATDMCRARGFRLDELRGVPQAAPGRFADRLSESSQVVDADACLALAAGRPFAWAVVDHYGLAAAWERRMRGAGCRIAAIDDLANRAHECDVLVDQNLRYDGGIGYDGLVPPGCERLLGPRHALLESGFASVRASLSTRQRDGILVSFGGSDPRALTEPVLRALLGASSGRHRFDVVLGAMYADIEAVRTLVAAHPNAKLHRATRDMARLMGSARLFVGAGGSTSWERCCLALPGVVVSIAENQVASCAALHDAGSHVYLGNASEVTPEAIAQAAMAVLASPAWWSRLAERSGELVDGKGAQRVARRLLAGALQLRAASAQDADTILSWRNDPAVRRYAGADREIGAAEHGRWYERVLADPDCHLLIGEDALGAAGVLRYDVAARVAKVSIYLAPARIGGGAGAALLAAGEQWLALHRPDIDTIGADVQAGNRASVRLFTNSGYRVQAQHYVRSVAGRRSP